MNTTEKFSVSPAESSDSDSKDVGVAQIEEVAPQAAPFDAARTKTLLRKLDWYLVPFLALLYL